MRKSTLFLALGLSAPAWASSYGDLGLVLLIVPAAALGVPVHRRRLLRLPGRQALILCDLPPDLDLRHS
ncbi:hypothetical protein JST97_33150 [bacterium]|nr:hypothetical protein [bacterium]